MKTVAIVIADPYGTQLTQALQQLTPGQGWIFVPVPVLAVLPEASVYVTWPAWVHAVVDQAGGAPVGVIAGNQHDPGSLAAWQALHVQVLSGPVPACVTQWLQALASPQDPGWDWNLSSQPGDMLPSIQGMPAATFSQNSAEESLPLPGGDHGLQVAIYSSGGGVGKTTTSVYLAAIAAQQRQMTGLIEMDEDRRGILTYYDVKAHSGGLDSVTPAEWEDPVRLGQRLAALQVPVNHRLRVLPMIGTLTGLQYQTHEGQSDLTHLFAWARHQYGLTIYDLPARIRDFGTLATLQAVDKIALVVEPTEIMLDSSRGYLQMIAQLGEEGRAMIAKIGLVVNRVPKSRKARYEPELLAEALDLPLWGIIPMEPDRYMAGINQHQVAPDKAWEHLYETMRLPRPGSTGSRPAAAQKPHWSLFSRRRTV